MLEWRRIEAGEYESKDGRFRISKTWDRIYGDHWKLVDSAEDDRYKGTYDEKSLLECKLKAEIIISEEKRAS